VECHLIVAGKKLSTPLTFDKLIKLWRAGAAKPFEEVRSTVEGAGGPVELDRLAVYIKRREGVAVMRAPRRTYIRALNASAILSLSLDMWVYTCVVERLLWESSMNLKDHRLIMTLSNCSLTFMM